MEKSGVYCIGKASFIRCSDVERVLMSLMFSGKLVSPRDEEIRGGLKYTWAEGRSKPLKPTIAENVRIKLPLHAGT
jgi:hypothetical protein